MSSEEEVTTCTGEQIIARGYLRSSMGKVTIGRKAGGESGVPQIAEP